jgi:hypothetical protein
MLPSLPLVNAQEGFYLHLCENPIALEEAKIMHMT